MGDHIAQLCLDHFAALSKTGKPNAKQEWTVLAAIVSETPAGELMVVSMATGNKCVGFEKINPGGFLIHDSHAEVLAKRAFQR